MSRLINWLKSLRQPSPTRSVLSLLAVGLVIGVAGVVHFGMIHLAKVYVSVIHFRMVQLTVGYPGLNHRSELVFTNGGKYIIQFIQLNMMVHRDSCLGWLQAHFSRLNTTNTFKGSSDFSDAVVTSHTGNSICMGHCSMFTLC